MIIIKTIVINKFTTYLYNQSISVSTNTTICALLPKYFKHFRTKNTPECLEHLKHTKSPIRVNSTYTMIWNHEFVHALAKPWAKY